MKLLLLSLLGAFALVTPATAHTQDEDEPRPALKQYNLEKGLALSGYDPVAYFEEGGGKPAEGKHDLTAKHRGITYRFANEKNRDAFLKTPERFEPAYGGWCAYAMVGGDKVEIDPKSFLIEKGRLLVFYKGFFNDTRKKWLKEGGAKLAPKADKAWKKLITPEKDS